MEEPTFKIALLGNSQSGKTSLINKYINNSVYTQVTDKTANRKPYIKKVTIDEDQSCFVEIYDTIGLNSSKLQIPEENEYLISIVTNTLYRKYAKSSKQYG